MEIFNAEERRDIEINNLLQKIKYKTNEQKNANKVFFPILITNGREKIKYKMSIEEQIIFQELKEMDIIKLEKRNTKEINKTLAELRKSKYEEIIAEGYWIKPIEPNFSELCEKYKKRVNKESKKEIHIKKNNKLLVSRDNATGDYFYKNKIIAMDKNNIYYKIFDILYLHNNGDGFLSYEEIEKHLRKRNEPTKNKEVRDKRIKNAKNNLFRFAKIGSERLKNEIPNGKKLIEIIRGRGLKLNNQEI